jgi:hypothetical protein
LFTYWLPFNSCVKRWLQLTAAMLLFTACSSVKIFSKYELTDGKYRFHQKGEPYRKVDIEVDADSIYIYEGGQRIKPKRYVDQYYFQTNLDLDMLYTVFKYRPAEPSLPRQLTNNFNANIFLGYRLDRFHFKARKQHHTRAPEYRLFHRSVAFGVFGGIGSATMGPWTTNYRITDEYYGFSVSRGVMLLAGIDSVTFGLAMGFDRLTDRDKALWIYQNRPWYGLTIGLNIN